MNGLLFSAAATSSECVTLREAASLPEGPAELIVIVDGADERGAVAITDRHLVRQDIPIRIQAGPVGAGAVA